MQGAHPARLAHLDRRARGRENALQSPKRGELRLRGAYGPRGAHLPTLLRAVVACGWFGIQTWIGGLALDALVRAAWPGGAEVPGEGNKRGG